MTHPHHPLRGQRLPVVCLRGGANPAVIVRLPDGSHAAVALDATDYATDPSASRSSASAAPLLDLDGLRRLAQFLTHLRQQGRSPDPAS
jgi:Family of unknown function (DUF5372)